MAKIFIDPGHGGSDSGAVGNGMLEKTVNLTVALKLRDRLKALGFEVIMSRETDVYVDLYQRSVMCNDSKADFFISIHHNAGGGDGYEVIYPLRGGKGLQFAQLLAARDRELGQNPHGTGTYSREGDHGDYYSVIRETTTDSIISEYGYIDTADSQIFDTLVEQYAEAEGMVKAFCDLFGVKYVAEGQPAPQPQPQPSIDPAVLDIQRKMNRLKITGLNGQPLVEDGIKGPNTTAAISKFQNIVGLSADGVAGPMTNSAINSILAKPTLQQGSTGLVVRYLQFRVQAGIDGSFGPGTKACVVTFQRSVGLSADGCVGPMTWGRLIG